jgi:hypothetical protein
MADASADAFASQPSAGDVAGEVAGDVAGDFTPPLRRLELSEEECRVLWVLADLALDQAPWRFWEPPGTRELACRAVQKVYRAYRNMGPAPGGS